MNDAVGDKFPVAAQEYTASDFSGMPFAVVKAPATKRRCLTGSAYTAWTPLFPPSALLWMPVSFGSQSVSCASDASNSAAKYG